MTEEEAKRYLNKYCNIYWKNGGRTAGKVVRIKNGWLEVDYGYGIRIEDIERIEVISEPPFPLPLGKVCGR